MFSAFKTWTKSKICQVSSTYKKIQQRNRQQECTKPLNSSEGTSAREGGKKDKHEALNRIGRKHIFTGLSITVALYSTVEKSRLLTFTHVQKDHLVN